MVDPNPIWYDGTNLLLVFTIPPQSIGHAVVSCRLALLMVWTWLLVPLCWVGEDGGGLRHARCLGPVGLVMVRYAQRPIKSWCFHIRMSPPIHAAQCCIALCSRGWLFVSWCWPWQHACKTAVVSGGGCNCKAARARMWAAPSCRVGFMFLFLVHPARF